MPTKLQRQRQRQMIHQTQRDKKKFYQRLLRELELQNMPTPSHLHQDNPNAKRILVVCDEGVNRSITIKARLQYWGHDILTVGRNRNAKFTIESLLNWAELVIAVDQTILDWINEETEAHNYQPKEVQLWNIGEDKYPRPFNAELLKIVTNLIDEHRDELAPAKPSKEE